MKDEYPEFDDSTEEDIQNIICKNLENGNFLLLVVADEIDDVSRGAIDFLNSKLNDIRIEIIEVRKYANDSTFVLVPQHTNFINKTNTKKRKNVGDTTLEEIKNKGTSRQIEFINKIIKTWENKEKCYIEMGTSGLSMRYNKYSIFWLFINKIQISPMLKKQLKKNNKPPEIFDLIKDLLKDKTTIETEKVDINEFCLIIDKIYKKLIEL